MRIRIQTYNILSSKMCNADYFIHHKAEHLKWETRIERLGTLESLGTHSSPSSNAAVPGVASAGTYYGWMLNRRRAIRRARRASNRATSREKERDTAATYIPVYCFQEVYKDQFALIKTRLPDFSFHYASYDGSMGVLIMWPTRDLTALKTHSFKYAPGLNNVAIGVTFSFGTVWTCHLPCLYKVKIRSGEEEAENMRTQFVRSIHSEISRIARYDQDDGGAAADVANRPPDRPPDRPVVLAGDFNILPGTAPYLAITEHMTSAYAATHHGQEPPWTNIFTGRDGISEQATCDYIFMSSVDELVAVDTIAATENMVIPNADHPSDHIPVTAYFNFE